MIIHILWHGVANYRRDKTINLQTPACISDKKLIRANYILVPTPGGVQQGGWPMGTIPHFGQQLLENGPNVCATANGRGGHCWTLE